MKRKTEDEKENEGLHNPSYKSTLSLSEIKHIYKWVAGLGIKDVWPVVDRIIDPHDEFEAEGYRFVIIGMAGDKKEKEISRLYNDDGEVNDYFVYKA